MKIIALVIVVLFALGLSPATFAAEGGTKTVALMNRAGSGETQFGPLWLVSSETLGPTKTTLKLLHRIPESTLSSGRIREEGKRRSPETKPAVGFQRDGFKR